MQVTKVDALQMAPLVYAERPADQAVNENQASDGTAATTRTRPKLREQQLSNKQYGSLKLLDDVENDEKRPAGAIAVARVDPQSNFDAMEHEYDTTTEVTESLVVGNIVRAVVVNEDEDKLEEIPGEEAASGAVVAQQIDDLDGKGGFVGWITWHKQISCFLVALILSVVVLLGVIFCSVLGPQQRHRPPPRFLLSLPRIPRNASRLQVVSCPTGESVSRYPPKQRRIG
jgi:hypothetical protein